MRVGVEHADLEDLVEERGDESLAGLGGIDAGGSKRVEVGDAHARDPLLGEHAAGAELGIRGGDAHAREVDEAVGELARIARLDGEVELLGHVVEELGGEIGGPDREPQWRVSFDEPGDLQHGAAVDLHAAIEPGALGLHHHRRAIAQRGRVHLRDRGAGQRDPVELAEQHVDGSAELILDERTDGRLRSRRGPTAQRREFVAPGLREHVVAGGGHLTELHEDAAGLLEGATDTVGKRGRVDMTVHEAVAASESQHLAVAGEPVAAHAKRAERVAHRDEAGGIAVGEGPDGAQEVEADGTDHRQQRADGQRDQHHVDAVPAPVGEFAGEQHGRGPSDDTGEGQRQPAAAGAEHPTCHERDGDHGGHAEEDPSEQRRVRHGRTPGAGTAADP